MAYTVLSVFPASADTDEIKRQLQNKGFNDSDITVSKSTAVDKSADHSGNNTQSGEFWNFMFANDVEMLAAYSEESRDKTNIIVYTATLEEARTVKSILNDCGAIEVKRKESQEIVKEENTSGLPEDVYNGIIAKARHDVYFLDAERTYTPTSRGIEDTMDHSGSKD